MKKFMTIKKLLILSSIIFVFSACSNILDGANKKTENKEESVTVKGHLSTEGNARTAFVSFEGITWNVQAYNDKTSISADVEGSAFSIILPPGEWNLSAYGTDSTGLFVAAGTLKLNVTATESMENVIIPVKMAHGQGNISLEVRDETAKAAKLVCNYKFFWNGTMNSSPEFTANFINDSVTIKFENVYTGEAEITVYDSQNSKLFSCLEKINVLNGLTTDVFADCEYVKDGVLTITDEVLNSYAATQMDYPAVLWNRTSSDYERNYFEGAQIFGAADSDAVVFDSLFSERSNYWCFGDNKSIYVATIKSSDPTGFTVEKCVPRQNAYAASYEKLSVPIVDYSRIDGEYSINRVTSIAWASYNERSYLYVMYGIYRYSDPENPARLRVFDITDWDGTQTITEPLCLKDFSASGSDPLINDDFNNAFMTVSGNDIYIVRRTTESLEVRPYKFTITDSNYDIVYQDNPINVYSAMAATDFKGIENLCITDMTIVDNYLCMLVCSSSNYNVITGNDKYPDDYDEENYRGTYRFLTSPVAGSAGGILKYNLMNSTFEQWPDGSLIFGCYTKEMTMQKPAAEDPTEEGTYVHEPVSYIGSAITNPPAQLDANYFYGPRKIIARKPDELVIADDGYEWIDNDHFSERNRIVKLNLKKWAITSVENAGVMFDGFVCGTVCGFPGFEFKIE